VCQKEVINSSCVEEKEKKERKKKKKALKQIPLCCIKVKKSRLEKNNGQEKDLLAFPLVCLSSLYLFTLNTVQSSFLVVVVVDVNQQNSLLLYIVQ
jgi:hypothetical protein